MHVYVHHLLCKLEGNGAYPDGPGQVVTCSRKFFVLKKRNGMQQLALICSQGTQFILPDVTSTNHYSPAPQKIVIICYPNKCILMNMAVEL
jgi:hypothetical protein